MYGLARRAATTKVFTTDLGAHTVFTDQSLAAARRGNSAKNNGELRKTG